MHGQASTRSPPSKDDFCRRRQRDRSLILPYTPTPTRLCRYSAPCISASLDAVLPKANTSSGMSSRRPGPGSKSSVGSASARQTIFTPRSYKTSTSVINLLTCREEKEGKGPKETGLEPSFSRPVNKNNSQTKAAAAGCTMLPQEPAARIRSARLPTYVQRVLMLTRTTSSTRATEACSKFSPPLESTAHRKVYLKSRT